jgi:molybdenum cofactor sulfurtransferase
MLFTRNRARKTSENRFGHSGFQHSFHQFVQNYPGYNTTRVLDKMRETEFSRLDKQGHTYLDFTGGGMYAACQVKAHLEMLEKDVYGNPHSSNPTSQHATELTESARNYVLKYFNTTPEDYICIFTQNASGALKLLGEAYPFEQGDHLLLTFDNHNSVNGIREFARKKKASYNYSPIQQHDLRLDEDHLMENLDQPVAGKHKLFGFPAQSNVSGVKHDLKWIKTAQEKGWHVLLDAAAFVPTNRLDLGQYNPEFVAVSFYKIFGYPTGLGCLLVKRDVFNELVRPWFAGGTITIVSVQGDSFYYDKNNARFEDGTINYLDIPAIETGLKHIESIGIDTISRRVECLTGWAIEELLKLKHQNGNPLVKIYGPRNTDSRGGTIAMNFFDTNGLMYNFLEVEQMANGEKISLRTGCFCNPGIDETNHALHEDELKAYFATQGEKDYFSLIDYIGKKRGAVRISLGYISNFKDVYHFVQFAKGLLDKERVMQGNG